MPRRNEVNPLKDQALGRSGLRAICAAITTIAVASAVALAPPAMADPKTTTIDGRTYGPEDGLVIETGEVPAHSLTRATTTFTKGTSYVSNTETLQLKYTGRARAMANIYNDQRVIAAKFRYTRDGVDLTGWVTSNAKAGQPCSWQAGPEVSKSVNDSLNPNAPKTKFNYSFTLIGRGVCP